MSEVHRFYRSETQSCVVCEELIQLHDTISTVYWHTRRFVGRAQRILCHVIWWKFRQLATAARMPRGTQQQIGVSTGNKTGCIATVPRKTWIDNAQSVAVIALLIEWMPDASWVSDETIQSCSLSLTSFIVASPFAVRVVFTPGGLPISISAASVAVRR